MSTALLKFWGTRGSCAVSGPEYREFGGNTCCLEVRYRDALLIIDAGTGIRPLGHALRKEKEINIFLSHTHWDHLIGFPFFEPLYREGVEIIIWSPHGSGRSCQSLFDDLLSHEFFPIHIDQLHARLIFRTLHAKQPVQIGPLVIHCHATRHPELTYGFKIHTPLQTISYVTDNEIDLKTQSDFIAFHRGVDLFIHEAQYSGEEYREKEHWGHSSIDRAIELVRLVRPGKWFVVHHDPQHSDADLRTLEKLTRDSNLPCPIEWIPDNFVIPLKEP